MNSFRGQCRPFFCTATTVAKLERRLIQAGLFVDLGTTVVHPQNTLMMQGEYGRVFDYIENYVRRVYCSLVHVPLRHVQPVQSTAIRSHNYHNSHMRPIISRPRTPNNEVDRYQSPIKFCHSPVTVVLQLHSIACRCRYRWEPSHVCARAYQFC